MKTLVLVGLFGFTFASFSLAQLLNDDFNDGNINPALWQTFTPFSDSSVLEAGGQLVFQNRGRVLTAMSFGSTVDLRGRFAFTGSSYDSFEVNLRANYNSQFGFTRGISASFRIQEDTGNLLNNVAINDTASVVGGTIGVATFPISHGTFYDFRFTDDGTHLALYVSDLGSPLLAVTYTMSYGNWIGLGNREGAGGGSFISAGSEVRLDSISLVPEPTSPTILLIGASGILFRRRSTTISVA